MLTPDECRVLGVLTEKAHTTPAQYPLSLNAVTTGCNQKSNRHPTVNFDEDRVVDCLDSLRAKNLSVIVNMASSRVLKYKHNAREILGVATPELVILTEMLLRGPQTAGELRSRASRMHMLETLDVVDHVLESLIQRDPPLVQRLPPAPGSRAERYSQLLCPELHPLDAPASPQPAVDEHSLLVRVDRLEAEVADLRQILERGNA